MVFFIFKNVTVCIPSSLNISWWNSCVGWQTIDLILPLHRCVYSTVYSVLAECLWKKNPSQATRVGFEPTTSCLLVFITRRKNFINLWISRNPLLYRILAGLSSSGKLGGREVKTSALVSRRSWVRIAPESPVKFFPQTLGKHWVYSAIHTSV